MREHLAEPDASFVLKEHPGQAVVDPDSSLGAAGLLPAAIVNFASDLQSPFLKLEAIGAAQPLS